MFRNYFKVAFRSLWKNKTFSFINIFGLTLGTLCCLYILLYVTDQYSYDHHHADAKDIYRITCFYEIKSKNRTEAVATTAASAAPLMKQDFAEVTQFARVLPFAGIEQQILQYKDKTLYEKDAVYVDSTFFDMFSYHFVRGSAVDVLKEPYSAVLDKSVSDKLFGKEDPLGKTFTMTNADDGKVTLTVRAVVDESMGKSHLHANIFVTMNSGNSGSYMQHEESWTRNTYVSSYIKLRPGTDPRALERKLPAFLNRHAGSQLKTAGLEEQLNLQHVTDVHITPGLLGIQITQPVSASFLNILVLIALLIQVIACINFMNLSTARASKRAKEVGVRKVIGAARKDLVKQFLSESFLLTLISILIALPLLIIALPFLNQITQSAVTLSVLQNKMTLFMLGSLVILTALVAGSYPAFYLSAFRAIKVIKGNFTNHISASGIRRGLVVFQFVLSIVLMSGLIIIYSQLNYIKNKDLGFEKDQRIIFSFYSQDAIGRIRGFMNDLRSLPEVSTVSNASKYLSARTYFRNAFFLHGQQEESQKGTDYIISDENFVKTNGIKLISGRDFLATDSSKILINEAYAKQLGLDPKHAAGTMLYDNQSRTAEIVGVMKDFNYAPLSKNIDGFALWKRGPHDNPWPTVVVSSSTADYKKLLSKIETLWRRDLPGTPFSYSFLDESVQKQYEAEISMSHIINSFTIMAILISCLGLFGLTAFSAEQRSREIGIRKVLGASVAGLARLLSQDFLKLVAIAIVIAIPVSWWAMNKWLQSFAYRINLSWWMFALAGILAILIALITVSFQAIKAAVANPVKSLRTE